MYKRILKVIGHALYPNKVSGIGILAILVGFSIGAIGQDKPREIIEKTYQDMVPFVDVLSQIQQSYVDVDKADSQKLIQGAIKGMVSTLDPHSQFMDAEEYKELQTDTGGSFEGLGIEISIRSDVLTVVSPIEGTPAYKAGVKSGDKIIKINGETTKDITINEAVKKLRGPRGTQVTITILRESVKEPFDIIVTRETIKMISVQSYVLNGDIGYVRVRSFMEKTSADLEKALKDLETSKVKALILDLRGNPGGLLSSAVDVSCKFIGDGKLIVYTKGRIKEQNRNYYADSGAAPHPEPLVVLVNKGSASASEIVTGVIQDSGRGVIIGSQTFGKGSVQSIYPMNNGAGLKLTTAYYYTPSGRLIHEKGIAPDVLVEDEPFIPESVWKLQYYEHFIHYAKKYIEEHKDITVDIKISEKIIQDFISFAKANGYTISDDDASKGKSFISRSIKMEIVRLLKNDDAAQVTALSEDPVVLRAIDVLKGAEIIQKSTPAVVK